ncbi:MAG TPA: von Willebrand factor type A domain-containing protein [Chitinophagaceae bacterium]|nr:von Willebrand factor type A domain-containing protein [Chitinophagaceae bacterium]
MFAIQAHSQYYLMGAVYDENGNGIYNVKILLSSKGTIAFYTNVNGAFGIPLSVVKDTIILQANGYETVKNIADTKKFQVFTMKLVSGSSIVTKRRLLSLMPRSKDESISTYYRAGESYSTLVEHYFADARKFPQSGFALNINRASYSNIRRFLNMGMKVPQDAVRIEELLNYFDLPNHHQNTSGGFICTSQLTEAPWKPENELLFINLQAPYINVDKLPPANLVFLIDVSGSMDQTNRLPLLKEAFKMLVNNLRPQDTVAVVIYGGFVGTYLQPTSCIYKDSIKTLIEKLEPGGETPGEAAIKTAYTLAKKIFRKNANNRIILATDGDFNVGQTSDKELEDIVIAHRQSGIYLTCLGVGMGNYKDSKLEALAKKGNGNFAYLDNIQEAEKVLVTEFTKTLYAIANDAYVNISFNPAYVNKYRLIGFDNKRDVVEDSTSELEGGEVGTGHSFMAVYEIEPVTKANDSIHNNRNENIAEITLHYKLPANDTSIALPFSIHSNFTMLNDADSSLRFAAAVIMFGGLLKQSDLWKNYGWDDTIKIARTAINANEYVQAEFLSLIEKAKKIYTPLKKKKKKNTDE